MMCIIAVSKPGCRQPSLKELQTMFKNNPDGAGYMYARDGKVTIHKGFMCWGDLSRSLKAEAFTKEDPVVYHFRISTQAGVNPEMTHPFPLTDNLELCEELDIVSCPVGLAHNGIIRMTSSYSETRFSDTALFITRYMTKLIRKPEDVTDPNVIDMIEHLTNSKWAVLTGEGVINTAGHFINDRGVLFSNSSYLPREVRFTKYVF